MLVDNCPREWIYIGASLAVEVKKESYPELVSGLGEGDWPLATRTIILKVSLNLLSILL